MQPTVLCLNDGRRSGRVEQSHFLKSFQTRFHREHQIFAEAIQGIPTALERKRFTSVLLQRLMFCYFLQGASWLTEDDKAFRLPPDAEDFYRRRLRLFFERCGRTHDASVLARNERGESLKSYHHSWFLPHPIETTYTNIQIPDAAFRRLFDFIDSYRWLLDSKASPTKEVVTPDLLGFIFEKHIDQKQMGAYYTQEDISDYICRNTILPHFLDALQKQDADLFSPSGAAGRLLRSQPDRYIFESVRRGADLPLPDDVAAGLADVGRRTRWADTAGPAHRAPAESWREHLYRRRRVEEVREQIRTGSIGNVHDLVTLNLDVAQLVRDLLTGCSDLHLITASYHVLQGIYVLDPTCGAGAFLIAALDVLYDLYAICLIRMENLSRLERRKTSDLSPEKDGVLEAGSASPNLSSFVVRTIISRNLYGIDVAPEAVELCKLRLWLRLAAAAPESSVPPPSLRANFQTRDVLASEAPAEAENGRGDKSGNSFRLQIFPSIMQRGGFDVIIGNPPYVEHGRTLSECQIEDFATASCGNLYAFVVERSLQLCSPDGRMGMIIPHSAFCTDRMRPLRALIGERRRLWISTFAIRPSKLFPKVDQRLAIFLAAPSDLSQICSTRYQRWHEAFRPLLFEHLRYAQVSDMLYEDSVPKAETELERRIWKKLHTFPLLQQDLTGNNFVHYHNAPRYWIRATTFVPYFWNERNGAARSTQIKTLAAPSPLQASVIASVLNSSLFYWWFVLLSDCRHLNRREIDRFPLGPAEMSSKNQRELQELCLALMNDYRRRAARRECRYQTTGKVIYDEFYPKFSKSILDAIDGVLAQHFGLDAEELDFIIHYDAKYRMGLDAVES